MTEKPCSCSNIKLYDGHLRCMTCFKEFVELSPEVSMNMIQAAPAIARIQELETEVSTLRATINAMKAVLRSIKTPVEIETDKEGEEPCTEH